LLTLLVDAITVYVSARGSEDKDQSEQWSEAHQWIFSDDDDCASFLTACEELELPPDLVRKRVGTMGSSDLSELRRMYEP
jgi:hypothetical protein